MFRVLLSLILLSFTITSWAVTVTGLRLSSSTDGTRLVIDLDNEAIYQTLTLDKPHRLVIDLQKTKRAKKLTLPKFSNSLIKNIRYSQRDSSLRLVLDLTSSVKYASHKLTPKRGRPYRIVFDLHDPAHLKTTIVTKPNPRPKSALAAAIRKPIKIKTAIKPKAKPPRRDLVIAIDAGHGGKDGGATGRNGTREKDVVLAISKRLAKLVNKEPAMRAYLVRSNDTFISLRQRISRAHRQQANMFISIHADSANNRQATGASVYVLSERGASSEAAQLLADKENAADLVGGISLEDKDDLLASVLLDLSQTASLEASIEIANMVLSGLKRVGRVHKKQIGSASFVVLKSPDIPSVLIETAFISNPAEERKLNSANHQNKLAGVIMSAIRSYFQLNPLPNTKMPQQHIVNSGDTLSAIALRYQVTLNKLTKKNNLTSTKLKVGDILLIP